MAENENKSFHYCNKVDLHALDYFCLLETVVSVAAEHGFRGIVVTLGRLDELVKEIHRPSYGDSSLLPICAIDYPLGCSSTDVRVYSMISAKERGAKEVEIVAPYHHLVDKNFRKINEDLQAVMKAADKHDIKVKYVVDINSLFMDDSIKSKLCRIIAANKVPCVSTSLGFFDEYDNPNHNDIVLNMRSMKAKTGARFKSFVSAKTPEELSMYPKAGADIVGMSWNKAPFLTHAYEEMVDETQS